MTLVVAGNFGEFKEWQRTSGARIKDGVYVHKAEQLFGIDPKSVDLVLYGRYWLQPLVLEALIVWGFLVEEKSSE